MRYTLIMQPPVLNYARQDQRRPPRQPNPFLYLLTMLPFLGGFLLLHLSGPGGTLMSSHWQGLQSILLYGWDARAAWPLLLLALWAAYSAYTAALHPNDHHRTRIHVGLYVGIAICIYYLPALLMPPLDKPLRLNVIRLVAALLCIAQVVPYCCHLVRKPSAEPLRQYLSSIAYILGMYLVPAVLSTAMVDPPSALMVLVAVPVLILTPILPLITFCFLARTLGQQNPPTLALPRALAAITPALVTNWVIAYLAHDAIGAAPRCLSYVATAASMGHPAIVGTRRLQIDTHTIHINSQLRTLICAEITLRHTHIRLARLLRRVYDHLGPILARQLNTPWKADLAWCCLKPLELLATLYLRHHRLHPAKLLPIPK